MNFSTNFLLGLATLFGVDDVSNADATFFLVGLLIYFAFLFASRRLVGDIFKNDSPAQSSKRLVPWSVGAAFAVFVCGAIVFPLLAYRGIASLPQSWFPDFAHLPTVAQNDADAETPNLPKNDADAETQNLPKNDAANETPNVVQNDAANETPNVPKNDAANGTPNVPKNDEEENSLATQHPLARLLIRAHSTPWALETLLLCFFVAVIAAPFAEEFLFRVLFQGTLENYALQAVLPPPGTPRRPFADAPDASGAPGASEFRWTDPTTPMERRAFYLRSAFAILVPAFIFGLIHAGAPETPEEARDPETLNRLFRTMLAAGCANVAALLFGLFLLRRSSGATTGDVGFGPEFTYKAGRCFASLRRFALDFLRGVAVFAFIAPVIFGANAALRALFPNAIVDPFPIFLFALAEGVVYWRLRRYATVVGMHVALNATSFCLLVAAL